MGAMKVLNVTCAATVSRLRFLWPLFAALIIAGDGYLWIQWRTKLGEETSDALSLPTLDQWTPVCIDHPGRGSACHVIFSFAYQDASGGRQFAILGLSSNRATITAPIERSTLASWRVDGHPLAESLSTQGDGAVLSRRRSAALIEQMLTGKQLTVRFVESGTGRVIERSFPLAEFPKAYARYRQLQRGRATARSA